VRWYRRPLLHFVAGGVLLFVATRAPRDERVGAARIGEPIHVTAADVAQLRAAYTKDTGLEASADDEAALVEDAIVEELLFREALARGLDRDDKSVRGWLVEQMRVLAGEEDATDGTQDDALYARALELGLDRHDLVVRRILVHKARLLASQHGEGEGSEDELRGWYARNRDQFRQPERTSLWQVFVAAERRGGDATPDATVLLARFSRDATPPRDAARAGDAFAAPAHLVAQSAAQLAKLFGPSFARAIAALPVGGWSGPLASPYGAHLVWVEERVAGATAPFDEVRGRVLESWRQERRAERIAALLRARRAEQQIVVESAAWNERETSRGRG